MNPHNFPPIVQAYLKIAAKIRPASVRAKEINKIIRLAKLYFPQYFLDTQGNIPLPREKSASEKYIDHLNQLTIGITK